MSLPEATNNPDVNTSRAAIEAAKAPWRKYLSDSQTGYSVPYAAFFDLLNSKALHNHNYVSRDKVTELGLLQLFLDQAWHLGLNISASKRDAIARGDTSGHVAHPVFIPVAQLLGSMLANPRHSRTEVRPERSAIEAEQAQVVFDYLREPNWDQKSGGRADPLTYVQVYRLLGAYCALKADKLGSQEYMANASNLVLKYAELLGIEEDRAEQDHPTTAPPEIQEITPLEEGRSALAHMVYLELVTRILMKFEHAPRFPPVMLAKFVKMATKFHQETEVNFLKAKSALYLVESQQMAKEWDDWQSGKFMADEWTQRCRTLAHNVNTHLLFVKRTQHELAQYGAPRGQLVSFCGCALISLAALAELYAVFAPFHPAPRQKLREIIDALGRIAATFNEYDRKYIDCTLDVCYQISGKEIRERLPTPQWQFFMKTVLFPTYLNSLVM
ncbi:hypothetical protein MIND_00170700 [Mycena indigotica]|uniref:Uncharacterized protein n=1 Tax=Mycena indigotica TaxID=2126181 RepID=A0A8H6TFD5_9AGAR|nr:uncharacterized protein MIND_00170700 [Mycena indigotica]KAF7316515.1 hypothetical protein MIND_00170700 [Mycena indigotica]